MKVEEALELREEVESLEKALELCMQESDAKLRELATATGIPWGGKSHDEVVILVTMSREELDRLRPIVAAAKAWAVARRLDEPGPSDAARRRYETAEALVAALANGGEL